MVFALASKRHSDNSAQSDSAQAIEATTLGFALASERHRQPREHHYARVLPGPFYLLPFPRKVRKQPVDFSPITSSQLLVPLIFYMKIQLQV